MTEHSRYVQAFLAQLEIMHLLAQRSNAAVFKCIELFEADPLGASKRDILDYTGLSRPTVEHALRTFEREGIAHFTPETRRYRLAPKYVSYRGPEPQSIRALVPILQGEPRNVKPTFNAKGTFALKGFDEPAKELSPHHDDARDQDPESALESQTSSYRTRKELFAGVGFRGPNLDRIARVDAPLERARAWADWVERAQAAPKQYPQPFGYALKVYVADPGAEPPPIGEKKLLPWYHDFAWCVHGSPEHARYKREHPGFFECHCPEEEGER